MRRSILIVEADPKNTAMLQDLLHGDFDLAHTSHSRQALELMRNQGPDVVIADIAPNDSDDMDGFELCRSIKEAPYGELTQVILLADDADKECRLKGYQAGADDFLCKPLDLDEFLARLELLFRMRNTLMELALIRGHLSVQNADLETIIQQRTAEIVETRDITVFALAKLAESRDQETGEHLERIRNYAQILGRRLSENSPYSDQVDSLFLDNLYRSSPLHDVGKVGIPDAILQKPGQLSKAEFEIMKQHTVIGAKTLESAASHTRSGGFLNMAADIALCHHERFNGNGYPSGIRGQNIPLSARIVSLVDVFDALISTRVYKPMFDVSVAWTIITQQQADHFDPVILQAFKDCRDEFLDSSGQQTDTKAKELVGVSLSVDVRR